MSERRSCVDVGADTMWGVFANDDEGYDGTPMAAFRRKEEAEASTPGTASRRITSTG